MYQALAAIVFIVDCVPLAGAGAGVCARRRSNFLLSRQEKVTKEKATLLRASPSLRYGATCDARSGGAPQARVRARPRWTRAPQVARSEAKGRSV